MRQRNKSVGIPAPLGNPQFPPYNCVMQIVMVDDSIAFDGFTASTRALGGAEKAFAALAAALARHGHQVTAFNRCRWAMTVEGVRWSPLDESSPPLSCDWLIAFRRPERLEFVRQARHRILWHSGPGRFLNQPKAKTMIKDHQPQVLLSSHAQWLDWSPPSSLHPGLLPVAVRSDFLAALPTMPRHPPCALVTTHPQQGLDWLLRLWCERIHPAVPEAQLLILSNGLNKDPCPDALAAVAEQVRAAAPMGVRVEKPQGDAAMAQLMRSCRVHLYPGHADDVTAFTLMESQACGLPAVLRPLGAAPERVANGSSAYVVPDDDAFANLAAMLLGNAEMAQSMGAEARSLYQSKTWDHAAHYLEALLP